MTSTSKNLLLVDDDRLVLVTLAAGLSEQGYSVQTAETLDAAEALLSGGEKFDLAIIDISLQERSGFELAERLRTLDHVPFIFLTAYSEPKFVEQASQYGALCYLVKPIDPIQMGPVVKAALDRADELRSLKNSKLDLQDVLDQDRVINVAIGITMVLNKLSRKAASDLLRSTSRNQRCKLIEVAKKMVEDAESQA